MKITKTFFTSLLFFFTLHSNAQNVVVSSLNKDLVKQRARTCILIVALGSNKSDYNYSANGLKRNLEKLRIEVKQILVENGTEFNTREERMKETMKTTGAEICIIASVMETKESNPLKVLISPAYLLEGDKLKFQVTAYNQDDKEIWKGISKFRSMFPYGYFVDSMEKDGLL